ncbi:MAG: adenosylmethionine--8-amino-7-oxononanoate transaminase [Bacteroidia bacterium]|nr:adenosylmethionine--8-amino-7-oxononanoate transaminase [Bacteroidia bacterium]
MSDSLTFRDKQVLWHPYTQMKTARDPVGIVRGQGSYLFDEHGKRYIDAVSSWWVNIHGHSHPYIAQKVSEQLLRLEHVIFAGFTHEPAVQLAERLLKILPKNQSKVFYSDNGSTAVEVAIKMAIQFWHNQGIKKEKIIVFENSYHGDTFGAMSVSARSAFTAAFSSYLFDVISIPLPKKEVKEKTISFLKQTLGENKDQIAAFIFEPLVLGAGGMLMYNADTLNSLLEICKDNDVLCIADEVMTGFGRTGKLFACNHLPQEPDIICLSKGLTGGTMALGLTTCSEKIYEAFLSDDRLKTLFHGHSYTANPIACTAGLASLDLLLEENNLKNIDRICAQQTRFAEQLRTIVKIENVRCTGTILAFDIKTNENTSYFNSQRDRLYEYFLSNGIILRPLGNTLYIMPPYCISQTDLEEIYRQILNLFKE